MIAILIIVCLAVGGFLGFKIGTHFIQQENIVLHKQINLLDTYSKTWASEASQSYQLSNQIAAQQTNNLATNMHNVIQLLHSIQQQQAGTLNHQENEKVTQLINQAKNLSASLHE